MGNKNTSPHLTKINGHDINRFTHNSSNNDDTDNSCETSSYQSSNGKKYGPSPRFRRRQNKQGKKSQVCCQTIDFYLHNKENFLFQPASSYLNVSLQSIGDQTINLFSRSFNFLQSSSSSSPLSQTQNNYQQSSNSGVYRNQSRRKYQTSSLRNPYRRSSTNFPVRGHEAMFLPEFSIKGRITEADFEVNSTKIEVEMKLFCVCDLGHRYNCKRCFWKCD
jgi:hypothetical protein